MARTLAAAVAAGMISLNSMAAGWASPPDTEAADLLQRPAEGLTNGDLPEFSSKVRPDPVSADQSNSDVSLEPGAGQVLDSSFVVVRPHLRPFLAQGSLAFRTVDPAFGPQVRPSDLLVPDPPPRLTGAADLLCIAVAIYHEARNQPLDGQLAVASVILNRTKEPDRWGSSPCEIVTPGQFSFLSEDGSYPPIANREAWEIALEMAREALERGPSPLVGEADHYHTPAVDPAWNNEMRQVIRIDDHIFLLDASTRG